MNLRFASALRASPPALLITVLLAAMAAAALAGPPGSSAACTNPSNGLRPVRVAVVDHFFPGEQAFAGERQRQQELLRFDAVDIDGDRRRDAVFHGDVVALLLGDGRCEVVPFPVADPERPKAGILGQLVRVGADLDRGEAIDAVLLCWESSTLISAFGAALAPDRKAECQRIIAGWAAYSESWRQTLAIIAALEDLAARGLTVVTIAGNGGSRMVNAYSLARGVLTVGAADPDPEGRWISDNPLIDLVASATWPVRLVCAQDRPRFGYDVDGDGLADVPLERVSSYRNGPLLPPRESPLVLRGSSFAAPAALRQLLARSAARRAGADLDPGMD